MFDSLTGELNRIYGLFIARNEKFAANGKVSFLSHSLGSVMTYELLAHQVPSCLILIATVVMSWKDDAVDDIPHTDATPLTKEQREIARLKA